MSVLIYYILVYIIMLCRYSRGYRHFCINVVHSVNNQILFVGTCYVGYKL